MNLHFTLCLQHQDFVIINKPSGISVHKDQQAVGFTELVAKQLGVAQVWLVHRLDKITSGLLILALNKEAAAFSPPPVFKRCWVSSLTFILRPKFCFSTR